MALLIVLALMGVFGGYYVGKFLNPVENPAPPAQTPEQQSYEDHQHEEPLPRNIVIQQNGDIRRIELPALDTDIDLSDLSLAPAAPADLPATEETSDQAEPAEPPQAAPAASTWRFARALPSDIAERQLQDAGALPAWQRHALPIDLDGRPKIVIVLDDVGLDQRRGRRATALPGPLTLSYMAYADGLGRQLSAARDAGHELLLHVPMEPRSTAVDPGPNVLLSGMPRDELLKSISWNLDQASGFVGINNHMGSRFTADRESMDTVVEELRRRGLLFLDSVTSNQSVAHRAARDGGIPYAVRNVFLDHEDDLEAIRRQLRQVERLANRSGVAIAIGHPRDKTLEALAAWLPSLEDKGFQLVPISAVVQIATAG